MENALLHFTGQLSISMSHEGKVTSEHNVESNATSPNIHGRTHILLLGKNLRGHVLGRATEKLESLCGIDCETEINKLDELGLRVYDDVFKFDVSVTNAPLMQISYCTQQLL